LYPCATEFSQLLIDLAVSSSIFFFCQSRLLVSLRNWIYERFLIVGACDFGKRSDVVYTRPRPSHESMSSERLLGLEMERDAW
jgi:hypothetical protein